MNTQPRIVRYALSAASSNLRHWSVVEIRSDAQGKETEGKTVFKGIKRDCKEYRDQRNAAKHMQSV